MLPTVGVGLPTSVWEHPPRHHQRCVCLLGDYGACQVESRYSPSLKLKTPVSTAMMTDADVNDADVDDADTDIVGNRCLSVGCGEFLWSLLYHSGLLVSLCSAFC